MPRSWFAEPFLQAIKTAVRPCTAMTRRKELHVQMPLPRPVFEDFLAPLAGKDAVAMVWDKKAKKLVEGSEGLRRDATGALVPTRESKTLRRFEFAIRKGEISDKLFQLQSLDPPPPPPPKVSKPPPQIAQIGEEGVYEVETIRARRTSGTRTQYLVKWQGYGEEMNTWEPPSHIHPALVAAFNGEPPAAPPPPSTAVLPHRGAGCARARLSAAAQRRGEVAQTVSMVCGNVLVSLSESKLQAQMPRVHIVFKVLSIDKTGHIIWPTSFGAKTKAALRKQVRHLVQQMIDDPLSPVDATMASALTGPGTDSTFEPAKKRKLVEAGETWAEEA